MKKLQKTIITVSLSILAASAAVNHISAVNAEEIQPVEITGELIQDAEVQKIITEYSDLWTGKVVFKTGVPVQWYVLVPDDTEPKGCGATIKIPSLGWGTDTHNKEEGHFTLAKGDNLVYEFTPDKAGDYLFTCWMGSGCHSNYIHVTDDGTYNAEKPADPTNIRAERNSGTITVSFDAPKISDNAEITGYKIIATDKDGKRTKKITQGTTVLLENVNDESDYTIKVYTLATSGKSEGNDEITARAIIETTTAVSETTSTVTTSTESTVTTAVSEQTIITEYADLWKGNITVKQGVPVKWYVNVPDGTELKGCGATIKIPDLGWGTDTNNKNENHLTLTSGQNLVYEFTPQEAGDILFTCWMGSGCHYNYIHVTADGTPDSNAKTGGRGTNMTSATVSTQTSTTTTAAKNNNSANTTDSPKTGDNGNIAAELLLFGSLGTAYLFRKRRSE